MKKLQQLVAFSLILTCSTATIYGQDPCYQGYSECYQNNPGCYQGNPGCYQDNPGYYQDCPQDDACSAYAQSSNTAHWSVYIPITILVGAAILFGLADRKHSDHSSSSQDGLGSIANSKRRSSSSYGAGSSSGGGNSYKSYNSYSNYSRSQGCYSHFSS